VRHSSPSAPGLAPFGHRAGQLPGALRDLISVHERAAKMHGKVLPRVRVALGDSLIFDSAAPVAPAPRKPRGVELARTLLRRWTALGATRKRRAAS
jgi:hypothetical protein